MQILSLILILVSNLICSVLTDIVLIDFQQQALEQHNYYRQQLHCTGLMTLNTSLNTIAQNYAQYLAANNIFNHSRTPGLGENLYYSYSSAGINFMNGSIPTTAWYNEISLYNYSSPGFSSGTGHFTQVIWSGSTDLGIGIALTSDNQTAYVVANYYPAGNWLGQFAANVLPLCTTTTAVGSTTTVGSITTAGTTAIVGTTTGAAITTNTTLSKSLAVRMTQQHRYVFVAIVVFSSLFNLF
ncbi:unnamed protein product [Rotaria sp. Silwood1]|nr:unnamed protein product [Rotaria sp. Silwood1]